MHPCPLSGWNVHSLHESTRLSMPTHFHSHTVARQKISTLIHSLTPLAGDSLDLSWDPCFPRRSEQAAFRQGACRCSARECPLARCRQYLYQDSLIYRASARTSYPHYHSQDPTSYHPRSNATLRSNATNTALLSSYPAVRYQPSYPPLLLSRRKATVLDRSIFCVSECPSVQVWGCRNVAGLHMPRLILKLGVKTVLSRSTSPKTVLPQSCKP
jgi:hypothetical protein